MHTDTARLNGIDTQALRGFIDAVDLDPRAGVCGFHVTTNWQGGVRTVTRVEDWRIGSETHPRGFAIHTDEPGQLCGEDSAPNPQEVLMAALNACMSVGYAALCALEGIEIESLQIESRGELDLRGFLGLDATVKPGYDSLRYTVRIKGSGTREQFERIHAAVMATSPNYFNLSRPVRLEPTLIVG